MHLRVPFCSRLCRVVSIVRRWFLIFIGCFSSLFSDEEVLTLTDQEGREVQGILRAKDEASATVEINEKLYKIPFEKLSLDSIELVERSEPQEVLSKRFEVSADIDIEGKVEGSKQQPLTPGGQSFYVDGCKVDTIDGVVTVSNKDNKYPTKELEVKFVTLKKSSEPRAKSVSQVIEQMDVANEATAALFFEYRVHSLKPLEEKEITIFPFTMKHSPFGSLKLISEGLEGKYYGFVVAIYQNDELVAVKSEPESYEKDWTLAKKVLAQLPRSGDIVFQSIANTSSVSLARSVEDVTESSYSHCGVIVERNGKFFVLEACAPAVKETPYREWIDRGLGDFDVYRLKEKHRERIPAWISEMSKDLGKEGDWVYHKSEERIYSSELLFEAWKRLTGEEMGKLLKFEEDKRVQVYKLQIRLKLHAESQEELVSIITPKSLAEAPHLELVVSHKVGGQRRH